MDIKDTKDVHAILAKALEFGNFYGNNFDALWDMLSTNVERPFSITWTNASLSRERLGDDFEMFLQLFRRLEEYDRKAPWPDKFKFILVD